MKYKALPPFSATGFVKVTDSNDEVVEEEEVDGDEDAVGIRYTTGMKSLCIPTWKYVVHAEEDPLPWPVEFACSDARKLHNLGNCANNYEKIICITSE